MSRQYQPPPPQQFQPPPRPPAYDEGKSKVVTGVIVAVIILLAIVVQVGSMFSRPRSGGGKSSAPPPQQMVQVRKSTWDKGGFGSVGLWKVTFYNPTKVPLGNIKYKTTYFSETGNVVSRGGVDGLGDYTIQKVIQPGEEREIEVNDGFVHKEAFKAAFEVVSCEQVR